MSLDVIPTQHNQDKQVNLSFLPYHPSLPGSVSDLKHIQTSGLFHKGDQIVAINDLLTDSLDEVHTYLRRLSKDQVSVCVRLKKYL